MAKDKDMKPGTQLQPVEVKSQLQPWEANLDEQRAHYLREANPPFRKELEKIQQWYDREARNSILSRWELGTMIKQIEDDCTNNRGTKYGVHSMDVIQKFIGWDKHVLYNSLKLAKEYTQEEINDLCERRMPDGQLLSYSHLLSVVSLPREQRAKLLLPARPMTLS